MRTSTHALMLTGATLAATLPRGLHFDIAIDEDTNALEALYAVYEDPTVQAAADELMERMNAGELQGLAGSGNVNALAALGKTANAIVVSRIQSLRAPGTVNPSVWDQFKRLWLGQPLDPLAVDVERCRFFDTACIPTTTAFQTFDLFAGQTEVAGKLNLAQGQVPSDQPALIRELQVYVNETGRFDASTLIGYASLTQMSDANRKAAIQAVFEHGRIQIIDGKRTLYDQAILDLPQSSGVTITGGIAIGGTAGTQVTTNSGKAINGMGKAFKLPLPLPLLNGRPIRARLAMPVQYPSTDFTANNGFGVTVALVGTQLRPGGYFAA